jgi:ATP adenylyltransferase
MNYVNKDNSQRGSYAQVISDIAEQKICPFCPEHVHTIHPNPIEEKKYWLVTDNAFPYASVKHHILLVHKVHIEHIHELSLEAWEELHDILDELTLARNIVGGSFVMRFGDTHFTGASVSHLHAQLIQGDPDGPEYDKTTGVMCRVG